MKRLFLAGVVAAAASVAVAQGVKETPPHGLDSAFEKATTTKGIDEGLLNNDLYKKAVKEALAAKVEREKNMKAVPIGPSPSHAARAKFLEVLNGDLAGVGQPAK